MPAYYNENEPFAADWLRGLIRAKQLPAGEVDVRSIADVRPEDLRGFRQCHFFAGIGGWPLSLKLAGWHGNRPVWTGSPPCQPFSAAGCRKSVADDRHLWPHWFRLIAECKPPTIFGEQVARAVGAQWFDAVAHDLESIGYAAGAAVLPACAVGAPHIRERLWFVAHADRRGRQIKRVEEHRELVGTSRAEFDRLGAWGRRSRSIVADAARSGQSHGTWRETQATARGRALSGSGCADVADTESGRQRARRGASKAIWTGSAPIEPERCDSAPPGGHWSIEPGMGRVAHGIPARVGKLRALGNAIVPQIAAEFIRAASV